MQTWAWHGSGAEYYCGLWETKGDFIPLAHSSIIAPQERKVLRLYRCCGWYLVTQGQWPALPADPAPCCSPRVEHNVSGAGRHLGDGCLKDVGLQGQGHQVSEVFNPGAFYVSVPAQNWSTCGGNHPNFQCEAGEETLHLEMGLSGLAAACAGHWTYQVLWGHKSSRFSAFWEAQALTCPPHRVHPTAITSLWNPPQLCESASSSSETCQCCTGSSAKPILETFLKKSAVPLLGQKVFWQILRPLASKLKRDCPSHCSREQEVLGGSCCLSSNFSEEKNGAAVPSYEKVTNFKGVEQLLGGETQGAEDWKLDNFPSLAWYHKCFTL